MPTKIDADVAKAHKLLSDVKKEIKKVFIGKEWVVQAVLTVLLCKGHVLLEGNPGMGKTVLARSFSSACGCEFNRVQFTTDLLPTDILGLQAYNEKRGFYTVKGPIFTNILLGDEINRAPPKTQSAMLEAMAEKKVSLGDETFNLDEPFIVIATQNPIEQSGTYELPEAELDRFLFKVVVGWPTIEEEAKILNNNINTKSFDTYQVQPILTKKHILFLQDLVHKIHVNDDVQNYVLKIIDATRYPKKYGLKYAEFIKDGVSPRAAIGIYVASKANAIFEGKSYVTPQNVKNVTFHVLNHRLFLTYDAEPEGVTIKMVLDDILSKVKVR